MLFFTRRPSLRETVHVLGGSLLNSLGASSERGADRRENTEIRIWPLRWPNRKTKIKNNFSTQRCDTVSKRHRRPSRFSLTGHSAVRRIKNKKSCSWNGPFFSLTVRGIQVQPPRHSPKCFNCGGCSITKLLFLALRIVDDVRPLSLSTRQANQDVCVPLRHCTTSCVCKRTKRILQDTFKTFWVVRRKT